MEDYEKCPPNLLSGGKKLDCYNCNAFAQVGTVLALRHFSAQQGARQEPSPLAPRIVVSGGE